MKLLTRLSIPLLALALTCGSIAAQNFAPYKEVKVTQADVDKAIRQARAEKKFLMVEFGANWCEDCLVLVKTLDEGNAKTYFRQHFVVLPVDVGFFDRNQEIAKALDVQLNAIPTAVFFAPDGSRVGATNKMELEPSRKFGAPQILAFLKEVAERRVITSPAQFK